MRGEVVFRFIVAASVLLAVTVVTAAVWEVHQMVPRGVGPLVWDSLQQSGVDHPVTAVLLNFRAYDTLLEIVVLTVAFWGVWSLQIRGEPGLSRPPDLLLERVASMLIPSLIMLSIYLLWAGTHRPGGEFQAGAVLGAAGILTLLVGRPIPGAKQVLARHIMVVAGAGVFLLVAIVGWGMTGHLFGYQRGWEKAAMLVIETAAVVSIGFILAALFAGSAERLSGDVNIAALQRPKILKGEDVGVGEGEGPDDD